MPFFAVWMCLTLGSFAPLPDLFCDFHGLQRCPDENCFERGIIEESSTIYPVNGGNGEGIWLSGLSQKIYTWSDESNLPTTWYKYQSIIIIYACAMLILIVLHVWLVFTCDVRTDAYRLYTCLGQVMQIIHLWWEKDNGRCRFFIVVRTPPVNTRV